MNINLTTWTVNNLIKLKNTVNPEKTFQEREKRQIMTVAL